jgi:formylglycine-generating enzyme required for sulfatase activity
VLVGVLVLGLILAAALLGGSGLFQPQATDTPRASSTPRATSTPFPTSTPRATSTPSLGIGSTWERPKDGMTMLYVPAGEFEMGSTSGDGDEKPMHTVYLDAYWMDETEVTNGMFVEFLNDNLGIISVSGEAVNYDGKQIYDLVCTGCAGWTDRIEWNGSRFSVISGYADHPAALVTWYGAQGYCDWAGVRMPTEAEWEKAARGTDGRMYPWGDGFDCKRGNFDDETSIDDYVVPGGAGCDGYDRTSPVGSFASGKSPYGLYDMAGNVLEWVADWYDSGYYANSPSRNPSGPSSGEYRVLRGGSWYGFGVDVRSAVRVRNDPSFAFFLAGFRCSRSP